MQRLTFRNEDHDDEEEESGTILYGTPLPLLRDDQVAPKKQELDLTVRDEKGRRRFHGAFTGGFSAGFFNTVGSEEGWVPSQFVSSRGSKWSKDLLKSKPEDYMDDEDFNMVHGIAPKRIKTTDTFSSNPALDFMGPKAASSSSADQLSLTDFLKETIKPTKLSIGIKILKMMKATSKRLQEEKEMATAKKKEKKNVKKKKEKESYGCSLPPGFEGMFQEDDSESDSSISNDSNDSSEDLETCFDSYKLPPVKRDKHGMGYQGMLTPSLGASSSTTASSLPLSASVGGHRLKISGSAFGTGVLEEDNEGYLQGEEDNVYDNEDLSKYDFELRRPTKKSNREQELKSRLAIMDGSLGLEDLFLEESRETARSSKNDFNYLIKKYPPPKIPRDWKPRGPFYYKKNQDVKESSSSSSSSLSQKKKSRWDEPEKRKEPEQSSQEKAGPSHHHRVMDANVRRLIMEGTVPVKKETTKIASTELFKTPIPSTSTGKSSEPENQATVPLRTPRSGFLASKFTHSSSSPSTSLSTGMADSDVKLEAGLTLSSDLTVKVNRERATANRRQEEQEDVNLIGTKRRREHGWLPDKLLCKRFNLPVPGPKSFTGRGHDKMKIK